MNAKLTDKLTKLPETLSAATDLAALTNSLVEVERLVLKSNYENKQSGSPVGEYEARDFVVGEANTRGLSWKLNLCRAVAEGTFCKMVRSGVHGGNVRILGLPENVDTTIQIYTALVPAFEILGGTAFTGFADGLGEGEAAPNRTGWVNQWLIATPAELASAITESRANDTSQNRKIADMVEEANSALTVFQSSLTPAKVERAPREPKAPKDPKAPRASKTKKAAAEDPETTGFPEDDDSTLETSSGSEASPENTEADYPDVTYVEGATDGDTATS